MKMPKQTGINPDIRKIADYYGYLPQMDKAIEELKELIEAICDYVLDDCGNYKAALIDEIADVTVMIEQLRYFADISRGEVNERVRFKVERTLGRMAEHNKERTRRWEIVTDTHSGTAIYSVELRDGITQETIANDMQRFETYKQAQAYADELNDEGV
jgi:hypothetical protein